MASSSVHVDMLSNIEENIEIVIEKEVNSNEISSRDANVNDNSPDGEKMSYIYYKRD